MQTREAACAQDKGVTPLSQNETIAIVPGEAQASAEADMEGGPAGASATTATQDATEVAPQAGLRFDGVYVAEEYAGKMNDFVTGALVASSRRTFFRFYPNERVLSTSYVFPITAPANPMFTPEKVFVKLGQLDPVTGGKYSLVDNHLIFGSYEGTIEGLSLLLNWSLPPDRYSGLEGDIVTSRFHFLPVLTQD